MAFNWSVLARWWNQEQQAFFVTLGDMFSIFFYPYCQSCARMTSWGIGDSSNGKEKLGHLVHPHCQGMTVPCSVSLPTQLSFQLSFVRWKSNSGSHLAMTTGAFEDFLFGQKCLMRDSDSKGKKKKSKSQNLILSKNFLIEKWCNIWDNQGHCFYSDRK